MYLLTSWWPPLSIPARLFTSGCLFWQWIQSISCCLNCFTQLTVHFSKMGTDIQMYDALKSTTISQVTLGINADYLKLAYCVLQWLLLWGTFSKALTLTHQRCRGRALAAVRWCFDKYKLVCHITLIQLQCNFHNYNNMNDTHRIQTSSKSVWVDFHANSNLEGLAHCVDIETR